jgi:SecD/SecF fusion protein
MNRNNKWRLAFVALALVWSLVEIIPFKDRNLIEVFAERGVRQDAAFSNIVDKALSMQATNAVRTYGNLRDAIGTNEIATYFPFFNLTNELRPTEAVLNRLQRESRGSIRLGLDLQGGTSFLVEMDTNALMSVEGETNQVAVAKSEFEVNAVISEAVEVLRKRVDRLGVAEPLIQPQGANRILVQLPGVSEDIRKAAEESIQKVAYLEFRLVHERSKELTAAGESAPGYELLRRKTVRPGQPEMVEQFLVKRRPEMVGGIQRAIVTRNNIGQPEIHFELETAARDTFGRITTENVGRFLAIVLDGELQTAPRINSPITAGNGMIEGNYTIEEAKSVASVLENPLKAPLHIAVQRDVDPTLGADSIKSGIKASIYGILAVAVFMLIYYMFAGMVANIALITNVIILLGVMCYIDTTFTLPGIAGIVLTVGMAVDANVLIYERIREEQAKGKSIRGAIDAGYDRAFGTIFDSHVTTLISSIILIWLGTGSVKGFGVALTIGVAASLFTALVVTRLIFDFMLARNWLKSIKMLHLVPTSMKIDFMKLAVPAFILSWAIILAGNGYGIFVRGQDVLGVEFVGGYSIRLGFDKQAKGVISVDDVRKVVDDLKKGASQVSFERDSSSGLETLSVNIRDVGQEKSGEDAGAEVVAALKKAFPTAGFTEKQVDKIGPAVGAAMQRVAVVASLLAMLGILVYVAFRYEFSFAVGAVVAIIHDILMTSGCYFLTGLFGEGRELNATTVAALLTIIGFSINDTVVIFDRIREDLKLGVRGSFRDIINAALNQTLSRTIITSGTVFLATLSLYLFGGGPINDFAFCFLVGIITGTYSSMYIASALVLWWHKGERPKLAAAQAIVDNPMTAKV